jgi:hypothetical protein
MPSLAKALELGADFWARVMSTPPHDTPPIFFYRALACGAI